MVNCFSPDLHARLMQTGHGQTAANIEQIHTRLLQYRLSVVQVELGDDGVNGTIGKLFLLWQLHLHRVERMMITCGYALTNEDIHGFATLTRAILESTAVVGGVLSSFLRWSVSQTTEQQVAKDVRRALLGSNGGPVEFKNVLSWIESADKLVERTIPEKTMPNQLKQMYSALSEISHPNAMSNLQSISAVSDESVDISHRAQLDSEQLAILGTLFMTARLFMDFSHSFNRLLIRGFPDFQSETRN